MNKAINKQEKIKLFDPNAIGDAANNLFGLPFNCDEAEVVVIPVPWEVTVSYSSGTAKGPAAIFNASLQVDLFDPLLPDAWKKGIAMQEIPQEWEKKNKILRKKAERYIHLLEQGENDKQAEMLLIKKEINDACSTLNTWVKNTALAYLNNNKLVVLIGGDHSTPLGLMQAMAEKYPTFGILQIDAHADLRDAYEGFKFSHASIMFNVLKIKQVEKLVQVGIRDYCEAEVDIINKSKGRIVTFFDKNIKHQLFEGNTWNKICEDIIHQLPQYIYLSFDIDGLDPKLCPNTGTPVVGGFEAEQVLYLLEKIVQAKKKIIAFDINEVAPGATEWDANVAARLLYRISNIAMLSRS